MLLARWGEFMLWVLMPRAVPTADGFALAGRWLQRGVEIGNVRGLGC